MAANLLDRPLVERARDRKTLNLENMDKLQNKDPKLGWEGVKKQVGDFGVLLTNTSAAVSVMGQVARDFAAYTEWLRTGEVPKSLPGLHRIFSGDGARDAIEQNRRDNLQLQLNDADQRVAPSYGLQGSDLARWRLWQFDLQRAIEQSNDLETMPPVFTDEEVKRMRDAYVPLPVSDPRRRADGSRPSESSAPVAGEPGMPPVQPLDNAPQRVDVQGTVEGQATIQLQLQPSKWWDALEQKVDNLVKMVGSIRSNGPGTTGKSSPDAAAPATGFTGAAPY